MPLQNTIHGVVTETLDAILGSKADSARDETRPRLIGDLDLPIRHCLVVKKGVQMDQIRWIRSHEQVSYCAWPEVQLTAGAWTVFAIHKGISASCQNTAMAIHSGRGGISSGRNRRGRARRCNMLQSGCGAVSGSTRGAIRRHAGD